MNTRTRLLQIYITLLMVATFLLGVQLLNRTGGVGPGSLLGYSLSRVLLLLPVLILTFTISWLMFRAWRDPIWLTGYEVKLGEILNRESLYITLILSCSGVILMGAWIYQVGSVIMDPYFQGYFTKFAPFLVWGMAAATATLLFVRVYRFGWDMQNFQFQRVVLKTSGVVFGLFLLLVIFIAMTGSGLKPDLVGWGDPGTPVLPTQVFLLVALGIAGLMIVEIVGARQVDLFTTRKSMVADVLIFVFFWLLTIGVWRAQPLRPAYFAPEPVAPNFEYYPYSDAANYEVSAQELLIGTGFDSDVRRPYYSLFLAVAQLVNGVGYANILIFQIPLLALIPPLLYILGKGLHSRLAGGMVAGLAVFHEVNAIRLSSTVNVSHAKLLMSDLPTALGVIAFSVVLVYWWQAPDRHRIYPLFAGGILGVTMLVRSQVVVLLPSIIILIFVTFWRSKRQMIISTVLMVLGLICVLLPWFWRGQQTKGSLSLAENAQGFQTRFFGVRYSLDPDPEFGYLLPGETNDLYSQRMLSSAVDFIRTNPLYVFEFIAAHLLHNQVSTLLTLPPTYSSAVPVPYLAKRFSRTWEQCCSLDAYIHEQPYWLNWDGTFLRWAYLPLLFNLLIVSVGLGSAWRRHKAVGLLPLWISLFYSLGNSLVRSSGWRFNLPVDWVGLFYYGLGMVQVITWIAMFFTNQILPRIQQSENEVLNGSCTFPWKQTILISVLFLLVGSAIPISEAVIPLRYSESWLDQALVEPKLVSNLRQVGITQSLYDFVAQNSIKMVYGRALYPRFYNPNQGIPDNAWYAFTPQDYARLGFYLVGPNPQNVILPLESAPTYFPHGVDVIILGCPKGEYLEAQMVILPDDTNIIYQGSHQRDWNCGVGK